MFLQSVHSSKLNTFNIHCKKRKVNNLNESLNDDQHLVQSTLKEVFNQTVCISKPKLTQAEFDKANMELIVGTVSPFSLIEHPSFIKYCKVVTNFIPASRRSLMRKIDENFQNMKDELISTLSNVEYVCVTCDCWTAFRR